MPDDLLHGWAARDRLAFDIGARRHDFGPLGAPCGGIEGQLELEWLPLCHTELAALVAVPTFGPSAHMSAYYALC